MSVVFTVLLIAAIVAGVAYAFIKTRSSNKKADEVKNSQVNPAEKVDGLEYDTSEVDPNQR